MEPASLISIRDDVVILEVGMVTIVIACAPQKCLGGLLAQNMRGTSRSSSVRAEPSEHALSQRSLHYKVFIRDCTTVKVFYWHELAQERS